MCVCVCVCERERECLCVCVLIWIQFVAGPNCRYLNASGGECTHELNPALGGSPSSEVFKRGGLHLVVTEVVPISGGADKKKEKKKGSCAVQYLNEGPRKVGSLVLLVRL